MPFDFSHSHSHQPFSLESIIAWLEVKNPKERYNRLIANKCLIGKYVKANGGYIRDKEKRRLFGSTGEYVIGGYTLDIGLNEETIHVAMGGLIPFVGNTFGKALKRARKIKKIKETTHAV